MLLIRNGLVVALNSAIDSVYSTYTLSCLAQRCITGYTQLIVVVVPSVLALIRINGQGRSLTRTIVIILPTTIATHKVILPNYNRSPLLRKILIVMLLSKLVHECVILPPLRVLLRAFLLLTEKFAHAHLASDCAIPTGRYTLVLHQLRFLGQLKQLLVLRSMLHLVTVH